MRLPILQAISLLILLFPFTAHSETNNVGLDVAIVTKDCPFSEQEVHRVVEGEYLRARLKVDNEAPVFLSVKIRCVEVKNDVRTTGYAINSSIMLGIRSDESTPVLLLPEDHGTISIGGTRADSKQFFLNTIRDGASNALTELLRYIL
ncbi:hypothetical protein NM06_01630 [Vibrio sinaloensis]|uniref:DUF302 domain-containing protein n=1 Tax=Photobacterium sp. (strain ATCC 43367) TaxID=379097 RepID=A0A0A5I3X3_PHOS4|nr:hypothetical protein NM06_01630 [Vibrio sinaloensis]